jgi:Na+-transporting NADH:ubiquinone oxidoreductase subunit NqrE
LLQEVSIASAVTFGFFEFIFYWSVILGLAALLALAWERWQASKKEKGISR